MVYRQAPMTQRGFGLHRHQDLDPTGPITTIDPYHYRTWTITMGSSTSPPKILLMYPAWNFYPLGFQFAVFNISPVAAAFRIQIGEAASRYTMNFTTSRFEAGDLNTGAHQVQALSTAMMRFVEDPMDWRGVRNPQVESILHP